MKQQTKWAVRAIVRYGAIWGCSYMISILVILMTEDILRTQGVAISRFLDSTIYIVDILIFVLIATKLEKRIKFYLQFGFAPGKSEKKQIATWKKIKELGLPIKDQLFSDAINHLKLYQSITKIKGVALNDGGKEAQEISDYFSAIILANHFKIELPLENQMQKK